MIREIEQDGFRFRIDDASQVLFMDCPEDISSSYDVGLAKSVADAQPRKFVSASMLAARAKAFDDGLLAAVELAAAKGVGTFTGKEKMLAALTAELGTGPGSSLVHAARQLGASVVPKTVAAGETAKRVQDFLCDESASKPLGFYTWSAALEGIFRRDRFLQQDLEQAEFAAVVRALHADPELRRGYEAWMRLNEQLTNPFTKPDLRPALAALELGSSPQFAPGVAMAPASASPEGALVMRLFSDRPIPEGFNLADRLIEEIRKGGVDLGPGAKSGWYDWIAWSLETLAAPDRGSEAKKLEFSKSYRETLEAVFKGILALARESHVKQLLIDMFGAAFRQVVRVCPRLTVEPLPTHYLRRGLGYRFVREVLESTFGEGALAGMCRLTADGPVATTLAVELEFMEELFFGAHAVSCAEISLEPDPRSSPQASQRFTDWVDNIANDPDLQQDNRMMVPVFYDEQRKMIKVWAFLGWTSRPLSVSFKVHPKVELMGVTQTARAAARPIAPGSPNLETPQIKFESAHYRLIYPITAEVYVAKLMNREEFRAHCDRYKFEKEILANLGHSAPDVSLEPLRLGNAGSPVQLADRTVKVFDRIGGTIGRALDNDWTLPDPTSVINRRHAAIDFKDGQYVLRDLSINGTYVNGSDVPIGHGLGYELRHGDRLTIGDYKIAVATSLSSLILTVTQGPLQDAKTKLADLRHPDPGVSVLAPKPWWKI